MTKAATKTKPKRPVQSRLTRKPPEKHGKKARAVELLLSGHTYKEVATELSVDPSTLYIWRHEPDFQEALQRGRAAVREGLTAQLADASTKALRALVELATDPKGLPEFRLNAAVEILDRCAPATEGDEPDGSAKRGGPVVQVVIGDREQAKAWLREHRAAKDGGQG